MGERTEYFGGLVNKNNNQIAASPHQSQLSKGPRDNRSAGGRKSAGGMSPFTHGNLKMQGPATIAVGGHGKVKSAERQQDKVKFVSEVARGSAHGNSSII